MDSVLQHLMPFFDTWEARFLRRVSKQFKQAVADHPWTTCQPIRGKIQCWRACFPNATIASCWADYFPRKTPVLDSDLTYFVGLKELNVSDQSITDNALAPFSDRGIHTLNVSNCQNLTDAVFQFLQHTQDLNVSSCWQITGSGFPHIKGIPKLDIRYCLGLDKDNLVHLVDVKCLMMTEEESPSDNMWYW